MRILLEIFFHHYQYPDYSNTCMLKTISGKRRLKNKALINIFYTYILKFNRFLYLFFI